MPPILVNTLQEVLDVARAREAAKAQSTLQASALGLPALPNPTVRLGLGATIAPIEYAFVGADYQGIRPDEVFTVITDPMLITAIDRANAEALLQDPKNPRSRYSTLTPYLIARTL